LKHTVTSMQVILTSTITWPKWCDTTGCVWSHVYHMFTVVWFLVIILHLPFRSFPSLLSPTKGVGCSKGDCLLVWLAWLVGVCHLQLCIFLNTHSQCLLRLFFNLTRSYFAILTDSLISRLRRRIVVSVQTGLWSAHKVALCVDDVRVLLSVIPCVDDVRVLRELGNFSWRGYLDASPRRLFTDA